MGLQINITPADLEWAREAIDFATEDFPGFCREGISPAFDKAHRPYDVTGLDLSMIVIARCWLVNFEQSEHCSRAHSSYGCKHAAESWADRYVSNAALIAAASRLGIKQRSCGAGSPNTYLAINYRSWVRGFDMRNGWDTTDFSPFAPPHLATVRRGVETVLTPWAEANV